MNIPMAMFCEQTSFFGVFSAVLCQWIVTPGSLMIYLPTKIFPQFCPLYLFPFWTLAQAFLSFRNLSIKKLPVPADGNN